jgi:hypothetical protein
VNFNRGRFQKMQQAQAQQAGEEEVEVAPAQ